MRFKEVRGKKRLGFLYLTIVYVPFIYGLVLWKRKYLNVNLNKQIKWKSVDKVENCLIRQVW